MKKISRRDFLKTLGRGVLLGGSALVISKLIKDDRVSFTNCINSSICKSCSIIRSCELPQALSYRKVTSS